MYVLCSACMLVCVNAVMRLRACWGMLCCVCACFGVSNFSARVLLILSPVHQVGAAGLLVRPLGPSISLCRPSLLHARSSNPCTDACQVCAPRLLHRPQRALSSSFTADHSVCQIDASFRHRAFKRLASQPCARRHVAPQISSARQRSRCCTDRGTALAPGCR